MTGALKTTELKALLTTLCHDLGVDPAQPPTASLPIEAAGIETAAPATPAPTTEDLGQISSGQLVSDLVFGDVLARGDTTELRTAWQPSLSRTVAVKSLRSAGADPEEVETLLREAIIGGRLDHPNVVPTHALGSSPERGPFVVLKRVEGTTLLERIETAGPLLGQSDRALAAGIGVLIAVCRAVEYAHAGGVVHCDIKPANVRLGDYGQVYLVDWGSAVLPDEDPPERLGELVGTPAYLAPEVAGAAGRIDVRTDVYLLGATLYHLLEGAPPHRGATVYDVIEAARSAGEPLLGPGHDPALAAIVRRACAPDPDDRFPSVAALRQALAGYVRTLPTLRTLQSAEAARVALTERFADAAAADVPDLRRRAATLGLLYQQVLRQQPDSVPAAEGLRQLRLAQAHLELAQGNPAGASAALEAVTPIPAELVAALRAAEDEAREEQAAVRQLARERDQQRFRGSNWRRSGLSLLAGAVSWVVALLLGWLSAGEIAHPVLLVALGGAVVWNRSVIWALQLTGQLRSERYLRLVLAFESLIQVGAFGVLAGWISGMAMSHTLLFGALAATAAATTLALTVESSLAYSAALWGAAALFMPWWPQHGLAILGAGALLNGLLLAWLLRPDPTRLREPRPQPGGRRGDAR